MLCRVVLLGMLLLRYCLLLREGEYVLGLRLTVGHAVHLRRVSIELIHRLRHPRLGPIGSINYCAASTGSYWQTRLEVEVTLVRSTCPFLLIAHAVDIGIVTTD